MKTRKALERQIRKNWPTIVSRAGVRPEAADCLPQGTLKLLGSSRKTAKTGDFFGALDTAVLYLSPATESGKNLCPFATKGCAAACLGHNSGQLSMPHAARSRLWKTALYKGARALFLELLGHDIRTADARAKRAGHVLAVRLDGSSDTGLGERVAARYPGVVFYDYTKDFHRALRNAQHRGPDNYHVAYSYSGENDAECGEILRQGGRVAAVFDVPVGRAGRPAGALPPIAMFGGEPWIVTDGDKHDYVPADLRGSVRGLRFKAAKDRAGHLDRAGSFVVPCQ